MNQKGLIPSSKTEILINGYLRELSELFKELLIPNDIIHLCFLSFGSHIFLAHWYFNDEQNKWHKFSDIDQNNLNESAKNKEDGCQVSDGRCYVRFNVQKKYELDHDEDDTTAMSTDIKHESSEFNSICVIDNGSYSMKCGFGGHDIPSVIFPTLLNDHRLIKRGVIDTTNGWTNMERIWKKAFNELNVSNDDGKRFFLTQSPNNGRHQRKKCAEIMFETFNVSALHIADTPSLALYAQQRLEGIVVDIGYDITTITCKYNRGWNLDYMMNSRIVNCGGRHIMGKMVDTQYAIATIEQAVRDSILEDKFQDIESMLYENIILCGGCLRDVKFRNNLIKEIKQKAPSYLDVNVMPYKEYLGWIGASMMTSTSRYDQLCVTKEAYLEKGANVIND